MQLVPLSAVRANDYVRFATSWRRVVSVDGCWVWVSCVRVPRPGVRVGRNDHCVGYEPGQLRKRAGDFAQRMETTR